MGCLMLPLFKQSAWRRQSRLSTSLPTGKRQVADSRAALSWPFCISFGPHLLVAFFLALAALAFIACW